MDALSAGSIVMKCSRAEDSRCSIMYTDMAANAAASSVSRAAVEKRPNIKKNVENSPRQRKSKKKKKKTERKNARRARISSVSQSTQNPHTHTHDARAHTHTHSTETRRTTQQHDNVVSRLAARSCVVVWVVCLYCLYTIQQLAAAPTEESQPAAAARSQRSRDEEQQAEQPCLSRSQKHSPPLTS